MSTPVSPERRDRSYVVRNPEKRGPTGPRPSFLTQTITPLVIGAAFYWVATHTPMTRFQRAMLVPFGKWEDLTPHLVPPTIDEQIRAGAVIHHEVERRPMFPAGGELPSGSYQVHGSFLSDAKKTNAERWVEALRRHEEDYQAELAIGRIDGARAEAMWREEEARRPR
ncbi:hypothetical protein EP7_004258 [Isosphaeraceae bacterium EP7]